MSAPNVKIEPSSRASNLKRLDTLAQVASLADQTALSFFSRRADLRRINKSHTDFVTEADHAVENCIREAILKNHPDDRVVGEELGGEASNAYWLVDPIDGTSNFLSGLPLWSISIAFIENNHPVFGAVSIPSLGRCLIGGKAFGIRETSGAASDTSNASLVFGIGQNEHWSNDRRSLVEDCIKIEGLSGISLGSCATSLAFVASGELAGYAEGCVGFWDIAAGVALCEAAQVPVSFLANGDVNGSFVAAGPTAIQKAVFDIAKSGAVRSDDH